MGIDKTPENDYIVVIRGGTRLRFEPDEDMTFRVEADGRSIHLTFMTQYVDEGFETLVPRDLWIDARGQAASMNEAVESFVNTAYFFTTLLSFIANGFAGHLRFHLAYESAPGLSDREFFEQFVEDTRGAPLPSRRIRTDLATTVIEALARHKHTERLRRAIGQYVLALQNWSPAAHILAAAHLFMGIEALVPIIRKEEIAKHNLQSTTELADEWNIQVNDLDGYIRRMYLFRGDEIAHREAKRASDAFEHGFLGFDEIRVLASNVRDRCATYLRQAIIEILQLPVEIEQALLAPPYERPIGTDGYTRYLRGLLRADHDHLAAEGQIYPIVDWQFRVTSVQRTADGKYTMSFSENFTPRIGQGVSFVPQSREVYGPEGIHVDPPPRMEKIEPEIIKREADSRMRKALQEGGVIEEIKIRLRNGDLLEIRRGGDSLEEEE